jgi:hypothetical protein
MSRSTPTDIAGLERLPVNAAHGNQTRLPCPRLTCYASGLTLCELTMTVC